jgi:hypothetical protein
MTQVVVDSEGRAMVKALITFLPFVVSTATTAGCRREEAHLSATDSQATTVTASSVVDSQPSVLPPASTSASAGPPSPEDTSQLHFSSPEDSLCGDLAENGFKADGVRTVVAAQFGRPDSVRVQPAPNPHRPAQTDTVVDVFYPGLRLHYWVLGLPQPQTDILLEADVSDNKYLKYPQLGIGATAAEIASALGEPERTPDRYNYSCALHIMSGADVTFHLAGGRVRRVDYRWEAD